MTDRCVECGYPRERHDSALRCPSGGKMYATMNLPPGMICADCQFYKRFCEAFLGYKGTETSCDWYPIRFVPRIELAQKGKAAESV